MEKIAGTAIGDEIAQAKDELVRLRRYFHSHPEKGYREIETSRKIKEFLEAIEIPVKTGFAETGLTGLIRGKKPGPVIMYRADMDALPISEENPQIDYRSQNQGVSHACGHDAHMAVALLTAKIIKKNIADLSGSVVFLFQPSEELAPGGAQKMIQDGALDDPKPDAVLGLHVWNDFNIGKVGITPKAVFASTDEFTITLTGSGGHGALPHRTVDTIYCASQIAVALQELASREIDPLSPFILSLGQLHAGSAYNIIPGKAEIQGTIRCFDGELRNFAKHRIQEISKGIAAALRCGCEVSLWDGYPTLWNDPVITKTIESAAAKFIPGENILTDYRTMGSEDFSYYLEKVPGCFFIVGSSNREKGITASHHSPDFNIDEDSLLIALQLAVEGILTLTQSTF